MKRLFLILLVIIAGIVSIILLVNLKYKISNKTLPLPNIITRKEYYCPDDYTLRDKKCYKTDIVDSIERYYCNSGYLQGTQCVIENYYPTHKEDNCPSGYTMSGFKCKKSGTMSDYSKCKSFDMTYSYLTEMCYPEIDPIETTECYFGELIGNRCIDKSYVQASYENTCPNGYTLNYSTCEKEIEISAYER